VGLRDRLRKRALSLGNKAITALMADEKRAQRLANAFSTAQRGKEALDKAQGQLLHTLGFASKDDYAELVRAATSLADRLSELEKKIDRL
jgi:hypothetical protein